MGTRPASPQGPSCPSPRRRRSRRPSRNRRLRSNPSTRWAQSLATAPASGSRWPTASTTRTTTDSRLVSVTLEVVWAHFFPRMMESMAESHGPLRSTPGRRRQWWVHRETERRLTHLVGPRESGQRFLIPALARAHARRRRKALIKIDDLPADTRPALVSADP